MTRINDHLEPAASEYAALLPNKPGVDSLALLSIAISLKRLANPSEPSPVSDGGAVPRYTSAVGEAAQAYLDSFSRASSLPGGFFWHELYERMVAAALTSQPSPPPTGSEREKTVAMLRAKAKQPDFADKRQALEWLADHLAAPPPRGEGEAR